MARNARHLRLWVGAEDLGPALHGGIVVEVLLGFLHSSGSTVVGSVNRLSCLGGNVHVHNSEVNRRESSGAAIHCGSYSFPSPLPSFSASTRQKWECPQGLCSSHLNPCLRWQGSSGPVRDNEETRAGTLPLVRRRK